MKYFFFIAFLLSGFVGMSQTYLYSDGNANTYKIFKEKIEYVPVTKENSSSGMYSGGEPKTTTITIQQYDSLKAVLEEAIGAKEFHAKNREKQSGQITKAGKKKKTVILQPRAAIRNKIEKQLKHLME
jgi:lipopolysaccharide export LptBFGC system permease protein LptF